MSEDEDYAAWAVKKFCRPLGVINVMDPALRGIFMEIYAIGKTNGMELAATICDKVAADICPHMSISIEASAAVDCAAAIRERAGK